MIPNPRFSTVSYKSCITNIILCSGQVDQNNYPSIGKLLRIYSTYFYHIGSDIMTVTQKDYNPLMGKYFSVPLYECVVLQSLFPVIT